MTDEPKIIVDEDWKSQVQAEKEALAQQAAPAQAKPAAPGAGTSAADAQSPPASPVSESAQADRPPLPQPTMPLLFTSLATQAMFALGRIADPQTGKAEVHLDEARHVIDTLQLLEDKTKGNLSPQESAMLTRLLYDLRMEYVAARDAAPTAN